MKMSAEGMKLLMQWEGCKLQVYRDAAGLPTIGVGHLILRGEDYSRGITTSQALDLLAVDLDRFEKAVTTSVHVPLEQHQFDALVAFAFNIGVGAFGKSTLLRILNQGLYGGVPPQLRQWTKAGGKVCQGLVNRRDNEIKLWIGEYV